MDNPIFCLYCNTEIEGRSDKKFCNPYCKSSYHYQQNKQKESSRYLIVKKQLQVNRRILKKYNKSGLSQVQKGRLIKEGFNPKFFTNYWKNKEGKVYLFCYEFGFLEISTPTNIKYILVTWQQYMEN